jgi:membrane protein implicated in regulation of membrane protease activity
MWDIWWLWVVAGFALAMLEVAVPGYIFLGFAIGAGLTGILLGIGVLGGNPALLLLAFALLSLIAWIVVRQVLGVRTGQVKHWTRDINDN